jgi:imidazolonepropionase-like amidohydrolase
MLHLFDKNMQGKYADIIAVRGDVLRHINLLQNLDIVVKRGKRYK